MTWQPGNVFGIISSWCGYRFSAISQYLLTIFSDIMGSTKGFLLRQIGTMPTATTLLTLHTKNVTHRRCHVTVIKQTLEKSRQPISFFVIVGFVLSLWLHIMWNHWFYGCQYNVENKTCQLGWVMMAYHGLMQRYLQRQITFDYTCISQWLTLEVNRQSRQSVILNSFFADLIQLVSALNKLRYEI